MTLKVLNVSGSHYECGRQIGSACAELLRQMLAYSRSLVPTGLRWEDYRQAAQAYLYAAQCAFPWTLDELRGVADGAGVDFLDLFVDSVEEIFPALPTSGCSDFAACPPATTGHTLLAHNNDLSPQAEEYLLGIEWELPDHPRLFTIGVGPFLSIGLNAEHIALTGNELSPNDQRPGIPRQTIARAILSARDFDEAVTIALHPDRASSYNNIITSGGGRLISVEASASDHELLLPEDGWLIHTNHYTHPRMKGYEQQLPEELADSVSRLERARHLMRTRSGPVTLPILRDFLCDHESAPASLCWHDPEGKVKTVFSALIDLTEPTVDVVVGNPCRGEFVRVWG
jgi:isopenicillin-N N-acyltransferase-like protein